MMVPSNRLARMASSADWTIAVSSSSGPAGIAPSLAPHHPTDAAPREIAGGHLRLALVMMPVSILDLATVGERQTVRDSLEATVVLARHAESAGFRRVWYAEHHNMAS